MLARKKKRQNRIGIFCESFFGGEKYFSANIQSNNITLKGIYGATSLSQLAGVCLFFKADTFLFLTTKSFSLNTQLLFFNCFRNTAIIFKMIFASLFDANPSTSFRSI